MVDPDRTDIPMTRQCDLLSLARSSLYYRPHRDAQAAQFEQELLNAIDELYTARPHLGRYGMTDALAEERGIEVNPKRVRRLMKMLGLQAVYPRPRRKTSQPSQNAPKYPYLLRNLEITAPDQVWCSDITYIRLWRGFAYLVAVMDWYSRCVLSWELSNTLEANFCVSALEDALAAGRRPEIFNTDQGSQFTSERFTQMLRAAGITISMDGAGRAFDNIMVERLWRTVKYEDVYLRDYQTPGEARLGLERYFAYYNHRRRHRSLGRRTPAAVYGVSASNALAGVSVSGRGRSGIELAIRRTADMIETGGGGSATAAVAATPVALRAPSVAATAAFPSVTVPPYPGAETVQSKGTS